MLVYCRMLPGAGRRHKNSGCGGVVDCCRRLQRGPREDGWPETGKGDCGSGGDGRPRRSCGSLPPARAGMMQILEDVGGGEAGEGSAVPDRLHPGI